MKVVDFMDVSDCARLLLHAVASPWLPWRAETALAARIADVGTVLVPDMRRKTVQALEGCLGAERSAAEIHEIARASFRHRWVHRELVWLLRLSGSARSRRAAVRSVRIAGLENLRDALSHGKGAILLESHLGKRVLARGALREAGFEICQVHRIRHGGSYTWFGQHVLRPLHRRLSASADLDVVEMAEGSFHYLRTLTAKLARNGIVSLPAFGNFGYKFVAIDILGFAERFPTGVVSLARASGARLLPLFSFEDDDGADHVVIEAPIHVALDDARDAALIESITQYARLLESYVRRYPAQWPWWPSHPLAARHQLAPDRRVIQAGAGR